MTPGHAFLSSCVNVKYMALLWIVILLVYFISSTVSEHTVNVFLDLYLLMAEI